MENLPFLNIEEIYLFNRGELYNAYTKFGVHIIEQKGKTGTFFVVWVPGAKAVCVVGDFNLWQSKRDAMLETGITGVWTLFIPKRLKGLYKFEIVTPNGDLFLKSDPFAFYSEHRPLTASRIYSLEGYPWQDQAWISQREKSCPQEKPLLIYEVHLGSWRRKTDGSFFQWADLTEELLCYVLEMGYTHIELMPLMEHPYDGSWGYQATGYYSCTSRYGTPHDFMYFIDCCHQAGIGVILDWVPGHFCKDSHGLGKFNGSSLYEKDEHGKWGTYNFNFSKPEVWSFLISNAVFWLEKFHLDGLRVDGVSSMLYLDFEKPDKGWERNSNGGRENLEAIAFMQRLNEVVFRDFPGILMIAEEATDWPLVTYPTYVNGLGYNFKWNMGWMNDTLRYMQQDFFCRKDCHNLLNFSLTYAFSENFVLPLSHDEVVHGKQSLLNKMPGDYWQKFAGLRNLLGYQMGHPGKKLMFMGGEIAQFIEWRYDAELDWLLLDYEMHKKFQAYVKELNKLYQREKAFWENEREWSGFEWIDADNKNQSILAFCRRGKNPKDLLIIVINFQPVSYRDFRIGIPQRGIYQELFNSDQDSFGGSNCLNKKPIASEKVPWHGRAVSLRIKVPPLATVIFKPQYKYKLRRGGVSCLRARKVLNWHTLQKSANQKVLP
ncbi:alpha-1,4-glucan:alpha-1,4-glucan 6-glycosyltransferase [Desulfosporosinus acidiphilus SJ4]|uniref:1,4-alpha-glucan branching enzyme GlgB n=1 Tax=Desulfosporosinus acidiphilus (strain DSM 22704 / JCM 16185 / SJ4) TaxID=646529 RepID=I4D2K5_DESAJ|nr:1,4-alpha-glucan branching protein GlgB [Desulfosporosinus acidiphilus]AFM40029.1 alpha-1,4-glucan:alpha-1,4-glucan 6-glycosyltransferase [Desulfosporosinus acidiphilus SJ4]